MNVFTWILENSGYLISIVILKAISFYTFNIFLLPFDHHILWYCNIVYRTKKLYCNNEEITYYIVHINRKEQVQTTLVFPLACILNLGCRQKSVFQETENFENFGFTHRWLLVLLNLRCNKLFLLSFFFLNNSLKFEKLVNWQFNTKICY